MFQKSSNSCGATVLSPSSDAEQMSDSNLFNKSSGQISDSSMSQSENTSVGSDLEAIRKRRLKKAKEISAEKEV